MSRTDPAAPAWFAECPKSNYNVKRMFNLFSLDGWTVFGAHWDALDKRMKETIVRTTQG